MILEEPFAHGNSPLHRCDPRVKVVGAVVYATVVVILSSLMISIGALFFSIMLAAVARLSLSRVIARLLIANIFIGFLWLVVPWTFGGEPVLTVGSLALTREGLLRCLLITVKCNAILVGTLSLLGTSKVFDIAHALLFFKLPKALVVLLFFSFRYLHVIHAEFHSLQNAMDIRSFRPHTNIRTYRTYANLVGQLFVRSNDRATRIYQAMLCRGFTGDFPLIDSCSLRRNDCILGTIIILGSVTIGVIECLT